MSPLRTWASAVTSFVRRTGVRARRMSFSTLRRVVRGLHRYRAVFTPAPRFRDTMTGSAGTAGLTVGGR